MRGSTSASPRALLPRNTPRTSRKNCLRRERSRLLQPDIVFQDGLQIELGGVTVRVRHVGGDHSRESSVMFVEPDRVLFLGDCMYASPAGILTAELVLPLLDVILGFDAELYVDGHSASVFSRSDIKSLIEKARLAEKAVREGSAIPVPDEDTEYFVQAFRAAGATAS